MATEKTKIAVVSDAKERSVTLVRERLPWLLVGLGGGALASFMMSRFEHILMTNIRLAFFVPAIVYMSDAVGTQTETIFVRDLTEHRTNFRKYLAKELGIGSILGVILGVVTGVIAALWLQSADIALTVGIAMFVNVLLAPVVAIVVPEILFKEHKDPALGAGPFTTVIQDLISLFIYFSVASIIVWHTSIFSV